MAIYGGAFDPPHLVHIFTVTWLLQRADLDEVWLLPAANHAFGKVLSPFADRAGMLEAVVAALGTTRVRICAIENEISLSGRTFDTLSALQTRHPEHTFRLVIGSDNLSEAHRWHRFDELVARWSVIAVGRPGHEASVARFAGQPWLTVGPSLPEISSTRLRAAVRGGGDLEAMAWLPEVCRPWLERLYRVAPPHLRVWIFGAGRTGRTLAAALRGGGVEVAGIWNRSPRDGATHTGALPTEAPADVWVLTVSDPALPEMAARLAALPNPAPVALHCAGRLDARVLEALGARGVALGSLHPLQALGDDPGALRGAFCAVEGDEVACTAALSLVQAFGGQPVRLPPGGKPAWHAAAVLAANFIPVLTAGGAQLLAALGVDEARARALLNPLQRGTVGRLAHLEASQALTGPLARKDWDAVAAHSAALLQHAPEFLQTYQVLARTTAQWLGFDVPTRHALERALDTTLTDGIGRA